MLKLKLCRYLLNKRARLLTSTINSDRIINLTVTNVSQNFYVVALFVIRSKKLHLNASVRLFAFEPPPIAYSLYICMSIYVTIPFMLHPPVTLVFERSDTYIWMDNFRHNWIPTPICMIIIRQGKLITSAAKWLDIGMKHMHVVFTYVQGKLIELYYCTGKRITYIFCQCGRHGIN